MDSRKMGKRTKHKNTVVFSSWECIKLRILREHDAIQFWKGMYVTGKMEA
ncbi:MAG: hypothetical protein HFI07_11005 [Lachnospiraceae bacterium]|nr:hypothetical protein [Lachnospiraceae bacterium]